MTTRETVGERLQRLFGELRDKLGRDPTDAEINEAFEKLLQDAKDNRQNAR